MRCLPSRTYSLYINSPRDTFLLPYESSSNKFLSNKCFPNKCLQTHIFLVSSVTLIDPIIVCCQWWRSEIPCSISFSKHTVPVTHVVTTQSSTSVGPFVYWNSILRLELGPGLDSDRLCPFSVVVVERYSMRVVTVLSNSNGTVVDFQ